MAKKINLSRMDPLVLAPLDTLVHELGINDWDAIVIGDGSGGSWSGGCGWASVLIDRKSNSRKLFQGGSNFGTVYLSELMACWWPLVWYASSAGKAVARDRSGPVQLHFVTDNEVVARQGNGLCSCSQADYLWDSIDKILQKGYRATWHWRKRNLIGLNQLTDHLSRQCRRAVEAVVVPEGTSIYDFNPDGDNGRAEAA